MNSNDKNLTDEIGNSIYQRESKNYYALLRDIHTQKFTFNPKRIEAERTKKRYFNGNVEGINNLYTFIDLLCNLLKDKNNVNGVDYGCGNHFFISDLRRAYGWDVVGYDSDEAAIESAKIEYPDSKDSYIYLDLLKNRIPLPDESQDFVFCNAVIQHFSDAEADYAFNDISRILKPGGIFVLIFKRNIDNWSEYSKKTGLEAKVLDEREGRIKIEDKSMRVALHKLSIEEMTDWGSDIIQGLRIFHFFSIEKVMAMLKFKNLKILTDFEFNNKKMEKAIFKYNSGKEIPTAALFFRKD